MTKPAAADSSESPLPTSPLGEGRFVLYRKLGEGSQAQTFEGVDRKLGIPVAIKRFDVHGATSWKDVELAEREARVLSTLRHPALPAYVHHFEEDGALYLVTQKVEGTDLSKRILSGKRFTFEELLALLETLGDVFAYLHQHSPPIVHRDVKPSNIVERPDGTYALIDFGSVRDGLRPAGGSTVVGTFGFMAPEQFQGRALPASDLYGLGATLITLLTGVTPDKLPHRGLEVDVRAALHTTTPPEWLDLVERLLASDPDRRSFDLRTVVPVLRAAGVARARASSPFYGAAGARARSPSYDAGAQPRSPFADAPGARSPFADAPRARASSPSYAAGAERPAASETSDALANGPIRSETEWFVGAGTSLPFLALVVLSLLRVLLFFVMQVALPILLTVLSVVFGRGLRKSANDVAQAGREVNRQLSQIIDRIARSGPLMVRRRHRSRAFGDFGPPRVRVGDADAKSPQHPHKRSRIGNFDVELPIDVPESDEAARSRRRR